LGIFTDKKYRFTISLEAILLNLERVFGLQNCQFYQQFPETVAIFHTCDNKVVQLC